MDGPLALGSRIRFTRMKLLLDTHIWIWAIETPEKLGRAVRRQIGRQGNELYLSPVCIWEAHMLVQRKRLRLRREFSEWLDDVFKATPLREAPFNFAVAAQAASIQLPHGDPGDLFLAATALVFDLTLVTADEQLLSCPGLKTLANE
jgi:PIN domain nuclease of toxin-antitoxin system